MRIKAITNLLQQVCLDSSKTSIHFSTYKLGFAIGLLLRRQCLTWVLSPRLLHRTVRMLTSYFPGIRINYHKLFERARNLHLLLGFYSTDNAKITYGESFNLFKMLKVRLWSYSVQIIKLRQVWGFKLFKILKKSTLGSSILDNAKIRYG